MSDQIDRQAAIDAVDSETVSTNPENFKSSEKFIKFMDDADIASFGKWQWANGFNTALVAATIQLKKLPSATPKQRMGEWIPVSEKLPEKYGNYLISIHGEDEPDIGTINPNDKRGWSLCDANGFHWASDKELIVTAWMPLPEPYRAERRTDE